MVQDLKLIRDLIAKGWCKGFNARTIDDVPIGIYAKEARKFCLLGAVDRVVGQHGGDIIRLLRIVSGELYLPHWNDSPNTTQQDVLDLLDRTIEYVENQVS